MTQLIAVPIDRSRRRFKRKGAGAKIDPCKIEALRGPAFEPPTPFRNQQNMTSHSRRGTWLAPREAHFVRFARGPSFLRYKRDIAAKSVFFSYYFDIWTFAFLKKGVKISSLREIC